MGGHNCRLAKMSSQSALKKGTLLKWVWLMRSVPAVVGYHYIQEMALFSGVVEAEGTLGG